MIDPFEMRLNEQLESLFGERSHLIRGELRDRLRKLYASAFEDGRAVGLHDGHQHERAFVMGYEAATGDIHMGEHREGKDVVKLARSLLSTSVRFDLFDL